MHSDILLLPLMYSRRQTFLALLHVWDGLMAEEGCSTSAHVRLGMQRERAAWEMKQAERTIEQVKSIYTGSAVKMMQDWALS